MFSFCGIPVALPLLFQLTQNVGYGLDAELQGVRPVIVYIQWVRLGDFFGCDWITLENIRSVSSGVVAYYMVWFGLLLQVNLTEQSNLTNLVNWGLPFGHEISDGRCRRWGICAFNCRIWGPLFLCVMLWTVICWF